MSGYRGRRTLLLESALALVGVGNSLPNSNSDRHIPDLDALPIRAHIMETHFAH